MTNTVLTINNMTCDHCVKTVHQTLSSIAGVRKVDVSLAEKRAVVTHEGPLDIPAVIKTLEQEGYQATTPCPNPAMTGGST